MGATSITEDNKEEIIDDLANTEIKKSDDIDLAKLEALKALGKAKQQENKMSAKLVASKTRSINFGVIGAGQGGSRLSEAFYKMGYPAVCLNTTMVDLKNIDIPDSNKLLLEYSLGGAAKNLEIGSAALEANKDQVVEIINEKLSNSQINILCLSLGGGSGAGAAEGLVDILVEIGKPLIVLTVLPMNSEDAQTKHNSLITLSKLAKLTQNKKICNLIVADNAKIESILADQSLTDFYPLANKAITEPIDIFNTLSSTPSSFKGLDQMEFATLMTDGEGLSIYGEMEVANFEEDTALASAILENLDNNLLASNFDLTQSRYVGVLFAANAEVWKRIPSSSVSYGMALINDRCGAPKGVFKGVYTIDDPKPVVKVYSMFSGLLLPSARIEQLKSESADLQTKVKVKDENRNLNLQLDTGVNETVSQAQKIKDKIAAKSSAFGKLLNNSVSDRRKK